MSTVTITARPAADRGPAGAPRTAFVLAGGAALGAMQAGMVHALYERGIVPDLLVGTSAGALNAALLASRPPTAATAGELAAIWRGLRRSDVLPLRPATLLGGLAGRRDHLVPDHGLRRLATRHVQFERLEQASIPLHLVAFDLLSGNEVRLSDGPAVDAVLAAAAVPGVLPPVRWRGQLLTNAHLQDDLARYAPAAELIVLPALNPQHIAPTDFGHAGWLITQALAAARTALTVGSASTTFRGSGPTARWPRTASPSGPT